MPMPGSEGGRKFRVLVLGNVRAEGLDLLRPFAELTVIPEPVAVDRILAAVPGQDAILHKVGKIGADVMARQDRLRIIARHGVGLDDLDLDSIAARGIPVSTTLTANSNAVAEATLALMLAALRRIPAGESMIKRERRWQREHLMGRELRGARVGIIGYGRIGRLVARALDALGSEVVVHDAEPATAARADHPVVALDELFRTSDVVTVHCPLLPGTRHLIGPAALALMKPDAIVVNTSRGGLVDTEALLEAVTAGRIAGAALDVFDREPPDFDDPLFGCDRIVTTPHIAAMTIEAQSAMAIGAATEICRVLSHDLPPTNDVLAHWMRP